MSEPLFALNEGDGSEFRYNKRPKCPHCGTDHSVSDREWWELFEEGEHDVECPSCDLSFTVSVHVSFSYSTDEQEHD